MKTIAQASMVFFGLGFSAGVLCVLGTLAVGI